MNIPNTHSFRMFLYALVFIITYILSILLNKKEYITLYWIGLIGFLNVELMTYLTTTRFSSYIDKAYSYCYISCEHPFCKLLLKFRGDNYFLTFAEGQEKRINKCMLSLWGVLHVILFAIIGYFVPNVFWEIVIISILYELAEYLLYNCHDALDILLNVAGYLIGVYLQQF